MTIVNPSENWQSWREAAWGWFYPNWCHLCDSERAIRAHGYVGDRCRGQVKQIVPPFCQCCGLPFEGTMTNAFTCTHCQEAPFDFEFARASVIGGEMVLNALHRYKYHRALWLEPCLSRWLLDAALAPLIGQGWTCIVPVPLHPVREREREFNQATRLARHLGKALGIPVRDGWVIRVIPTPSQTRLNRVERANNMRDAFIAKPSASASGESVIILDDIFTTGATTNAVARVLKQLGAARVCIWTLARAV